MLMNPYMAFVGTLGCGKTLDSVKSAEDIRATIYDYIRPAMSPALYLRKEYWASLDIGCGRHCLI